MSHCTSESITCYIHSLSYRLMSEILAVHGSSTIMDKLSQYSIKVQYIIAHYYLFVQCAVHIYNTLLQRYNTNIPIQKFWLICSVHMHV